MCISTGTRSACQKCHVALHADDTNAHTSSKNIDTVQEKFNRDQSVAGLLYMA